MHWKDKVTDSKNMRYSTYYGSYIMVCGGSEGRETSKKYTVRSIPSITNKYFFKTRTVCADGFSLSHNIFPQRDDMT